MEGRILTVMLLSTIANVHSIGYPTTEVTQMASTALPKGQHWAHPRTVSVTVKK
jgi:hypothetical protein